MNQPKTLLIDDDQSQLLILSNRCKNLGLTPIVAKSGIEALALLQADPEIALIISDIVMPEMSGTELLDTLRAEDEFAGIPVILISGIIDETRIARYLRMPLTRFLAKPLGKASLEDKIIELLKRTAYRSDSISLWLSSKEIVFETASGRFEIPAS